MIKYVVIMMHTRRDKYLNPFVPFKYSKSKTNVNVKYIIEI